MTPQQIVGLGIRILAVWIAVTAFRYIVTIPTVLKNVNSENLSLLSYFVACFYLAVAVILWLFPMGIAHKLLPRTKFENTINLQPLEAARVGCALLGLWFFVQAFANILWYLFRALIVAGDQSFYRSLDLDTRVNMMVTIANLTLGLVMIVRAGRFAEIVMGKVVPKENQK